MDLEDRINQALRGQVADGPGQVPGERTCTAAQWGVVDSAGTHLGALGWSDPELTTPLTTDSIFDVASITKVFTATIAMIAVDRGMISLQTPVQTIFPEMTGPTLLQLLNHTSGLPAWKQYYLEMSAPDAASMEANRAAILEDILNAERAAPGESYAYSDLGYILLGRLLERVFGAGLDELVQTLICEPLNLKKTRFVNTLKGEPFIADAVPTEICSIRGQVRGEVHDENTSIQGGVCGHAGIFSTTADLLDFGTHLLGIERGEPGIVRPSALAQFWDRKHLHPSGHHVAGWDTPSGEKTSVGRGFCRERTVGHLGFTGTSLWIDRSASIVAVLLTNRVFPTRENPRILDFRIAFHEAVQLLSST